MGTNWSDDIVIAELSDEPALSEELAAMESRVVDEAKPPHVVLNFSQVTYVNSSNIGQLLKLRMALNGKKRQLRLCSVCDEVWSVFMTTGLDKVFRFAPDPLSALAGLQIESADGGR